MKWRALWFGIPALLSILAVGRLASLPLAILYGKVPEPETGLLLDVVGKQVTPIFGPAALIVLLARRFYLRGAPVQRWALLLIAAPVVAFVMMFATLEWGP